MEPAGGAAGRQPDGCDSQRAAGAERRRPVRTVARETCCTQAMSLQLMQEQGNIPGAIQLAAHWPLLPLRLRDRQPVTWRQGRQSRPITAGSTNQSDLLAHLVLDLLLGETQAEAESLLK